jgi:hypothetical protein
MEFQSAAPSIVKSDKQRELLNAWLQLRDKTPQPALTDYTPDRLGAEQRDLVHYKVFATANGQRFMINSEGSRLALSYGHVRPGNKGTWLDEYLDPEMLPVVLPVYVECTRRRLPVYTITQIADVRGQTVDYERLALPFFADGDVSDIVICAKLISEASRFELNNLFRVREKLPIPTIRAVIDQELAPSQAQPQHQADASNALADVVEI